jgi:hypothetical protein
MSSLLHQLCILQSIDKFELFTLHTLHICLVLGLVISLTIKLLFELLAGTILAIYKVELALLGRLLLLCKNHVLHVSRFVLFHRSLLMVPLSNGLLLGFGLKSDLFLSLLGSHFTLGNCFVGLIFHPSVHLAFHLLVHLLLAHAFFLGLLVHHVSLALGDNLVSTFASLIDLLDYL